MSGVQSGKFITGANAKISVADSTLAYCTDVSYSVDIQHVPVEVMGRYEVAANEPVAFLVSGSFSVVRYAKQRAGVNGEPEGADGDSAGGNNVRDMNLLNQVNPAAILGSQSVDMEVHVKTGDSANPTIGVFRLTDVRCSRRAATLNKRNILVDNYNFVAVLHEDMDLNGDGVGIGATGGPAEPAPAVDASSNDAASGTDA